MCEFCEGKEDISNRKFEDGSKFSDYMVQVNIEEVFNEKMLIVRPVEYENRRTYKKDEIYILYKILPYMWQKVR